MRTILLLITLTLFAVAATSAIAKNETVSLKEYHKNAGVNCIDCHGEKNPTEAKSFSCTECHGTPDEVAKTTESLKEQNPHTSIHWGTTLPCEECHKEHAAPRNRCTENCHFWPDRKTK